MEMYKVWFRNYRMGEKVAFNRRDFEWYNRDPKEGATFGTVATVKCRDLNGVFDRCNTYTETPWVLRNPTLENPDVVLEVTNERFDVIGMEDEGFFKRSMMVGDVVEYSKRIEDENGNDVFEDRYWMCDHRGWTEFWPAQGRYDEMVWEKPEEKAQGGLV